MARSYRLNCMHEFNEEAAVAWMRDPTNRVIFDLDPTLAVGLIGHLQLAFRHPANTGPTRQLLEKYLRETIEKIDPSHGDVYNFLMAGFDPDCDQLPEDAWPDLVDKI